MIFADEIRAGMVRGLRMTVHKLIFIFFLCIGATASHAAGVTTDPGTYSTTIKRVKAFVSSESNLEAWVFQSKHNGWRDMQHKNKRRDNVLFLPKEINALNDNDITLVVWYHGLGGFKESTFRRSWSQAREVMAETEHIVALVVPEMPWSVNTKTPRGRQGRIWRGVGEAGGFIKNTLKILSNVSGFGGRVNIIVVGHSAGGSAIASASTEGSICELVPNIITTVVWSDASYGNWLLRAHNGCLGKQAKLSW